MAESIAQLRKQVEELLQANEDLKKICEDREAFEYTGTAMLVINDDMSIAMGNRRTLEITGYSQEELAHQKKWTEYVHPDDIPRMEEYHRKRREDPSSVPELYEFRMVVPNGQVIDSLVYANMIPGTTKSIVSVVDITDRKRVERRLKESEERYRDLFENAGDIVYIHDLDGRFLSANRKALETYGFTEEELVQTTIADIVDPEYLPVAQKRIREKIDGDVNQVPYELLTHTKSGEAVWVEVNTRVMREDGKPSAIQGMARDITDRRAAEEAVRESRRRFRETTEMLPAIVCEIDEERKLTYVNQLGLESFGYTDKDLEDGLYIDDMVHPDDWPLMLSRFKEIFERGSGAPQEYRMMHKDGTLCEYLLNSSPIKRDSASVGLRTCLLDIHERRQAQRELAASEERFRSVFIQSPIGIALFDPDHLCIEANSSFCGMFPDLEPCKEGGRLDSALELTEVQVAGLGKGECVEVETTRDAQAGRRYLTWCVSPLGLSEGAPKALLVQVQDVTEQREAERARLDEARRAADEARRMVADLRKDMVQNFTFNNMVSRSPRMKEIFDILPQIAETPATVLVCGESGTGKELVTRSLHELSPRKDKPFVAVNCSALPDTLLESELFGYKAGAFTDAKKDKPGKFAQAEGGTIFLDEIGDISPAMQVKLLRVLQERAYEPLGATSSVQADVRVVAATNRDLPAMVKEGRFREDLYYRIKVLQITLPPLRDRLSDIPLLCNHFIGVFNTRYGRDVSDMSQEATDALLSHSFPGNIRELENIIEHAFVFCRGETIGVEHLPEELREQQTAPVAALGLSTVKSFDELEKLFIESVLQETGGNKLKAAERLGVHKATLFRKIKRLGIDQPHLAGE